MVSERAKDWWLLVWGIWAIELFSPEQGHLAPKVKSSDTRRE